MTTEVIAEFLATIGFQEDTAKSLDKFLKDAQDKIKGLKAVAIKVTPVITESISKPATSTRSPGTPLSSSDIPIQRQSDVVETALSDTSKSLLLVKETLKELISISESIKGSVSKLAPSSPINVQSVQAPGPSQSSIRVPKKDTGLGGVGKGAPIKLDPDTNKLQLTNKRLNNFLLDIRATKEQADQLSRLLAPSQILKGIEKIKVLEPALKGGSERARQLRAELAEVDKTLKSQLNKKQSMEVDVDVKRGVQNVRNQLQTGSKDLAQKLSQDIDKILNQPVRQANEAQQELRNSFDQGIINKSQLKSGTESISKQFKVSEKSIAALEARSSQTLSQIGADQHKLSIAQGKATSRRKAAELEVVNANKSGNKARIASARHALRVEVGIEKKLLGTVQNLEIQKTNVIRLQNQIRTQLVRSSLNKADQAYRSHFRKFKDHVTRSRNLLNSFIIPVTAALGIGKISDVNRQMEASRIALQMGAGSAGETAKSFQFLEQQSSRLGFSLQKIAPQYAKIMTNAKLLGFSTEQSQEAFLGVAEAASAMQLSTEDTEGVIRALVQMMSKGKISSEELRQQLGERMPGAFQMAAKAMGVTTQRLDEMLKKGEITAEKFIPLFSKTMRDFAAPNLESSTKSYQAELARLSNSVTTFFVKIGESGFIDIFVTGMQVMRMALMALTPVVSSVAWAINMLAKPFQITTKIFGEMTKSVESGSRSSALVLKQLLTGGGLALAALAVKSGFAAKAFLFLKGAAARLIIPFAPLLLKIGLVAAVVGTTIALFADFFDILNASGKLNLFDVLEHKFPLIGGFVKDIAIAIAQGLGRVKSFLSRSFGMVSAILSGDWKAAAKEFALAMQDARDESEKIADAADKTEFGLERKIDLWRRIAALIDQARLKWLELKEDFGFSDDEDKKTIRQIRERLGLYERDLRDDRLKSLGDGDMNVSMANRSGVLGMSDSLNEGAQSELAHILSNLGLNLKLDPEDTLALREGLGISQKWLEDLRSNLGRFFQGQDRAAFSLKQMLEETDLSDKRVSDVLKLFVRSRERHTGLETGKKLSEFTGQPAVNTLNPGTPLNREASSPVNQSTSNSNVTNSADVTIHVDAANNPRQTAREIGYIIKGGFNEGHYA